MTLLGGGHMRAGEILIRQLSNTKKSDSLLEYVNAAYAAYCQLHGEDAFGAVVFLK